MIINKDLNPERSIYFIGALIIEVLRRTEEKYCDFLEIYSAIKNHKEVSINLFSLGLDWLFLNGVVDLENGMNKKCF